MEQFQATDLVDGTKYRTYLCEDRVVKEKKTLDEILRKVRWTRPHWSPLKKIEHAKKLHTSTERSLAYIKESSLHNSTFCGLEQPPEAQVTYHGETKLITDPLIQERATPFREFVKEHVRRYETDPIHSMLEDFVNSNRELWMHGAFETTFDILANYGIDQGGQLKILDPGNLIEDRGTARQMIKDHRFLRNRATTYMRLFPVYRRIKPTFIEKCAENFSLEVFDDLWPAD